MNLKRVSIPNEIFIRRDLSILNSIPHILRIELEVSFGIETQSGGFMYYPLVKKFLY